MTLADELRRALDARGMSVRQLADEAGINRGTISRYLRGTQPSRDVVARLTEVLGWQPLMSRADAQLTATCGACGATFLRAGGGGNRQAYCDPTCRKRAWRRGESDAISRVNGNALNGVRRRLAKHQLAVIAFCRGCEPEGTCRDARCELRPVSPIPLERRRVA